VYTLLEVVDLNPNRAKGVSVLEERRMDPSKKRDYQQLLLSLVPAVGESIGNANLRDQVREKIRAQGDDLSDQEYWLLRNTLIEEGVLEQGRGRGGSVHRLEEAVAEAPPSRAESALYEPFLKAVTEGYAPANRIKRYVAEITAAQGRRMTVGKWTRPDITLLAVRGFSFIPGKRLEIITFEVKPNLDQALDGVFEALAHSAFAHLAFLAVDISSYGEDEPPDDRVYQECKRLGIGYITFKDPADYNTFDIEISAAVKEPDPYEADKFITTQISADKQNDLRELLR
jgi:hypothetical protein